MSGKRRKRHTPEQIVRKLRDADAMLNGGTLRAKMSETIASPFISVEGAEATDESSLTEVGSFADWGRSSVD